MSAQNEAPPKKDQPATRRRPKPISAAEAMRAAAAQLGELVGRDAYAVSSLKKNGEGWTADVEMTEIERIPDTSSVMASYRVEIDAQGQLTGFEQTKRYSKGQIDRT